MSGADMKITFHDGKCWWDGKRVTGLTVEFDTGPPVRPPVDLDPRVGGWPAGLPVTKRRVLAALASQPPTAETLRQWWGAVGEEFIRQGWGFIDHPRDPALVDPGGQHIDLIADAGGVNPRWQWLVKDL